MSELANQLRARLAFDNPQAHEAADNHRSYHAGQSEHQAIRSVNTFLVGTAWENARLAPLHAALVACVAVLERECCCPGESDWTTGKPILCDPCEALTALREVIKA